METLSSNYRAEYTVQGMTCGSCVKTVTDRLMAIPGVDRVLVDLDADRVEILSTQTVALANVKSALSDLKKYSVRNLDAPIGLVQKSFWVTYQPLFTLFALVLLVSAAYQFRLPAFYAPIFMNQLMAGFFIGLSFFKLLNLKAFAESFAGYDPLAKRWQAYGYAYPFIELMLGCLFVAGTGLVFANAMTILILTVTTVGVYQKLKSKSEFQCACLGTTFNLPLSKVTVIENAVMIAMAAGGLVFRMI